MSDYTITNGVVEYSLVDPTSPEYKPKAAKVTLSFTVAEGSDPVAVTAKVHDIAVQQVRAGLGLSHQRGLVTPETRPTQTAGIAPVEEVPIVASPRKRRTKEEMEAAQTAQNARLAPVEEAKSEEDPLAGLASLSEDAGTGGAASDGTPSAGIEDNLAALQAGADLASLEGPVEITIDDVRTQCQKTAAHLQKKVGNINDIRKLLASYGVPGYGSVPAEKRGEFIEKLKALAT